MAAASVGHRVTLTVVVHDAEGRASSALTARDFAISEKGQPRLISLFRNLRPPQQLIVKRPPQDYTVSNRPLAGFGSQQPVNVLVLDTRNTDPEFQPWMRSQALRFVSMLRPDAEVAFYQLAAPGLRLLHEFSHDKSHLNTAVAGALEPATAGEFERESSAEAVRLERYQQTCEAMAQMAAYLREFEGRKNLVWMSGDFPPLFDAEKKQSEQQNQNCAAMALAFNRSNAAVYPVDVRSPIAKEPFQPVAPGDPEAVPRNRRRVLSPEWRNTITTLAALTGGRSIENRSQLAEAMTDALAETRFAYELGFDITEAECDGGLHALRVRAHIRDAAVLAKQAFIAECDAREQTGNPSRLLDSPAIGLTVMPTVQPGSEALVHVRLFIAPSDLQWSNAGEGRRASVGIRIEEKTAAGDERVLISRTLQLTATNQNEEPVTTERAVKPDTGAQMLRIVVRDQANQREGSVTFPLTISQ